MTLPAAAHLEIRDGAAIRTVALGAATITIGRDPGCDVVLTAAWVAPHHARLEPIAGGHRIIADGGEIVLAGAAGTGTDDRMLHDGDILRLVDPATASLVSLLYLNPQAPRIAAVQHFATPPGRALLTIGRVDADLVLDQPLVARRHADLAWHDGGHVLHDHGSVHGTFVNGARVTTPRPLRPGDVVQIGTFRLTYDGDSLDSFDQRSAIRLDARDLRRVVGSRVLLDDTTVSIEPCEFVAIVGASGAGKSTLMMALCGFQPADSGMVAINGDDLYAGFDAYRSILGYVPQDDTLHRALPVGAALRHAARLRLPADTSAAELDARIVAVLAAVDMTAHQDKRIDALSGGQRKRVSIACELLADPLLLFLDEPTSGLDPGLERRLMYTLRRLADGGRTVVLVTHATANIVQCDHIAFMASGRLVYFGPPAQALEFFGVADFADIYALLDDGDGGAAAAAWQERFRGSLQHASYAVARPGRAPAAPSPEQHAAKATRARAFSQSSWRQLTILTRRYLELILADRKNLALLLLQAPVIGLLLLLVSRADSLSGGRIEAKKLLFMLATTGVWFGVINSAREICKEAAILRRERLAGLRAGPYLASKVVVLVGLVLIQSALLLAVVATRVRVPGDGLLTAAWLEVYATVALAGLGGLALGLCISALASTPDKAISMIPLVLVPQVLFAGIMFNLGGITQVFSYLTSSRAAVDALGTIADLNQMRERFPLPYEPQYVHTASNLVAAWAVLLAQAAGFLLVAWWALVRRRR